MKILVTGATGFVGSHLCDLLSNDNHELYCLVRNLKKAEEFNLKGNLIIGDLHPTKELTWIKNLPRDLDIVIHTAGIVHSSDIQNFYNFNSGATKNLVESLAKEFLNLHFTYISSLAAAGPSTTGQLINEEEAPQPVSDYGNSKLIGEEILKKTNHWSYSVIRPPMVIGPRDTAVLDIFKMVKSRFIIGPGLNFKEKKYSFINVFDLVNAIADISLRKTQDTFFVSHPEIATFNEIISTINTDKKKLIYIPIPHKLLNLISKVLKFIPASSRLTSDKIKELTQDNWVCDGSKYQDKLSATYKYNLKQTVEMTKEDYKKRNWL